MKLGIDFGSTYSTISKYNPLNDSVEALHLSEGAAVSIPSTVSVAHAGKGKIVCGDAAKKMTGNRAYTVFSGFKMLLVEPDPSIAQARNYTAKYTPRYITSCYLNSILHGVLDRFGKKNERNEITEIIEDLYICIPELWSSRVNSLDGRNILIDILKNEVSLPIRNVNVVTEPEAASAFFAHNFEKETKTSFNGHLLLIDYGGGTLDITLTQVISDGKGQMEIGYRAGCGVGENHLDNGGNITIGNAGLAYIQKTLLLALEDLGANNVNCSDSKFKKAMVDFEEYLKSIDGARNIKAVFDQFGSYRNFEEIFDEDPEDFTYIDFYDRTVPVTYHHLLRAYKDTIEGVLYREIAKINASVKQKIKRDPCLPESGEMGDFKIALVGGFGSFYLVQKQIAEIYNISSHSQKDKRVKNIRTDMSEQAISLGAALLASGRVHLQKTARYSIGLCTRRSTDKKKNLYYGIKYLQRLVPGRPYFICYPDSEDDSPRNRIKYTNLRNNLNEFAVGFTPEYNKFTKLPLRNTMLSKLEGLPVEKLWYIGFSINDNDIVSVHIVPYYDEEGADSGMVIPLDNYANMFDMTAVEEEDINAV